MFERRPILGLILGLNVCVLIWRISVQEQVMLDAEVAAAGVVYAGTAGAAASNANSRQQQLEQQHQLDTGYYHYNYNNNRPQKLQNDFVSIVEQQQQPHAQQHPQQLYAGKHLLSKRMEMNESAGGGASGIATDKAARVGKKYIYKVVTSLKQNKLSNNNNNNTNSSSNLNSNNNNRVNKYPNKTLALSSKLTTTAKAKSTTNANTATLAAVASLVTAATVSLQDYRHAAGAAVFGEASTGTSNPTASLTDFLPESDFSQLIDLHDFVYLMPQQGCTANIQVLILVHSAPGNSKKRKLIRETWGSIATGVSTAESSQLRVIFLLGAVESSKLQHELQQENEHFSDMIQGSFQDNYRNMTYKHTMAFKWFLYNCAHAQILIKVDDDVFVNTPQLLKYLKLYHTTNSTATTAANKTVANSAIVSGVSQQFNASHSLLQHPKNLMFCKACIGSYVKRSYRSKWRVSYSEYAGRFYPPYCPGYAIMYSPDVVLRLYKAVQRHKYFWIDDVHITGIMAQKCNLRITTSSSYILSPSECDDLLNGKLNLNDVEFLYAWSNISLQHIRALWRLYLQNTKNISNYSASSSLPLVNNKNYTSYTYNDGFR